MCSSDSHAGEDNTSFTIKRPKHKVCASNEIGRLGIWRTYHFACLDQKELQRFVLTTMFRSATVIAVPVFALLFRVTQSADADTFNYHQTDETGGFGPTDWGSVKCDNVETCVSPPRQ